MPNNVDRDHGYYDVDHDIKGPNSIPERTLSPHLAIRLFNQAFILTCLKHRGDKIAQVWGTEH